MSGLADRLVTAAEAKLNELHAADGAVRYATAARWATAAVLRELVEALEEERRDYASITRLEHLAEVIEKGEHP